MFNKDPFVVPYETIYIDGEWYDLEDTTHCVVEGQEYIWLEDQWYELNDSILGYPLEIVDDEPQRSGGWGSTLVTVLIVLFFLGAGMKVMKVLDRTDDAISNIEARSGVDIPAKNLIQPTPQPTSREEKFSQEIKDAIDPDNQTTRNYALSLVEKSHGGARNIGQVCDVWEKCYKDWTYVSDPRKSNYFSSASNTIEIGLKGDCDDFAILIASLVEAIGGKTRIITAQGANGGGHAYAEVYVTDNKKDFDSIAKSICKRYRCKSVAYHIEYDKDKTPRYWLNLDWQSKHPGGKFYGSSLNPMGGYKF